MRQDRGPPYPTLSHTIPPYPTLSHLIPHYPTLSHTIPHYPTLSHTIPHYPTFWGLEHRDPFTIYCQSPSKKISRGLNTLDQPRSQCYQNITPSSTSLLTKKTYLFKKGSLLFEDMTRVTEEGIFYRSGARYGMGKGKPPQTLPKPQNRSH